MESLSWRDFEYFAAAVFAGLDYDVRVTPRSNDGGFDVDCNKVSSAGQERVLVECKGTGQKVSLKDIRAFLQVFRDVRATRAVLVTRGGFTSGGRKLEKENSDVLTLLDLPAFLGLADEALAPNWAHRIDKTILGARKPPSQ